MLRMSFLIVENILVMKVTALGQDVLDFLARQKPANTWTADNGAQIHLGTALTTNENGLFLPNFVVPLDEEHKADSTKIAHSRVCLSGETASRTRDRLVIAIADLNKKVAEDLASLKAAEKLTQPSPADWTETK